MMKAIEIVKEDIFLGDIGAVIQEYVEAEGFSVVQDFVDGIGKLLKNQMCCIMEKRHRWKD